MALCLATSLIARRGFVAYDQLVRYKWWHQYGYMSSTGKCFDIGAATKQSIIQFEKNQKEFAKKTSIPIDYMDFLSDPDCLHKFNINCSEDGVAGNGALMRLAPVPLFFYRNPKKAVEYAGISGKITHGDDKAYDACRFYAALIIGALKNISKDDLLKETFYTDHKTWFGEKDLHPDIRKIADGSYRKKRGYDDGIRGKGYIVSALEAALWAFWSDENSFEKGVLKAVNLGDDTDTTAAIYGQLAGAYYGYKALPEEWIKHIYGRKFIKCLSKWIIYEGENWSKSHIIDDDEVEENDELPAEMPNISRSRRSTVHTIVYQASNSNNDNPTIETSDQPSVPKNHRKSSTDSKDKKPLQATTSCPPSMPKNDRRLSTDLSDKKPLQAAASCQPSMPKDDRRSSTDINDNKPLQASSKLALPSIHSPGNNGRRQSHDFIGDAFSKSSKK
ncbi:unnamed protein product [Rotaria sp. Silwood1]|nr:unnamed protein product [Rotaria sp. Silwood1]CAF1225144.1 unnamed protein product [Rotaria sp. Silwood1]CAF3680866.1 unnamed protein product [Rotaria sp. Silwood1]CAF3722311.1 unnamed protein product [Rotaria sp. Silwood1]CAF4790572.1 unnamed protein product [Rotaria sp. Silwood1]